MKPAAFLLPLVILLVPAYSQNPAPAPSPLTCSAPPADPTATWAREMPEDADSIKDGQNVSRVGRDIIIRGTAQSVSVVGAQCFVLGTVNGPVSVVNGSATILGKVNGPVSVVSGDIRVGGVISGACSVVGGRVIKSPGARIEGATSEVALNSTVKKLLSRLAGMGAGHKKHTGYCPMSDLRGCSHFFMACRLVASVVLVIISLLLVLAWPGRFSRAAAELGASPLRYLAVGLLVWLAFLMLLAIALAASILIIGLPFLGALLLLNLAIKWYGFTVLFAWIGHCLLRTFTRRGVSELACVFAGGVVFTALILIPCLGFLIFFVGGKFATGAAFLAVFRKRTPADPQTP